ncbi:MAG: branched-chain amino acid transporter permease [Clostridiaceae bacterium]|nr:branched-chain amino acid transporter permease [Clostridiaceae bacterium]
MTPQKAFAMIAVAALCTFATRVAPFLLFNGKKPIPPIVRYLGETLPPAVIALLVIYCVKSVDWFAVPHGAPELLCIAVVALLHVWKRNNLLSIGVGTILYMFLVQGIFV